MTTPAYKPILVSNRFDSLRSDTSSDTTNDAFPPYSTHTPPFAPTSVYDDIASIRGKSQGLQPQPQRQPQPQPPSRRPVTFSKGPTYTLQSSLPITKSASIIDDMRRKSAREREEADDKFFSIHFRASGKFNKTLEETLNMDDEKYNNDIPDLEPSSPIEEEDDNE